MKAKSDDKPAKPGKDTIYIDVDDEITSIIDKVEAAKQKIVALVLPKRAAALQSIVNMRLLRRSADSAGKSVVLITNEAALLPLAGAAGLHAAKNLQSKPVIPPSPLSGQDMPVGEGEEIPGAEELNEDGEENTKLDYHRTVGALAVLNNEEDDAIPIDDEADAPATAKTPKKKGQKVPDFDRFRLMLIGGIGALLLLIIFIILAIFVLPKATIAIDTSSTPVSADLNLQASGTATNLDEDNGIIPSQSKTTQQTATQTAQATGQKNNGQKASGSVKMTTCVSSPGQLNDVPAGVGINSNGLTFITQQKASFNFAGSCNSTSFKFQSNNVDIIAQQAGSKYNSSISGATVAGYSGVTASGSASGGTDDIITVVSQQDVDSAKAKMTSQNTDKFSKDFEKQLSDQGLYVLTSTMKISDANVTANPAVGSEASSTTVTSQITYTVMAVKKDDLTQAIKDKLKKQIDPNKQKIDDSDLLSGASIDVQKQSSPTNATLAISENTDAVPIINVASVKAVAKGQKKGDIQAALNGIPGVKQVTVNLSPFWVSKAPKNESKITVKLNHLKTSNDQ